MLRKKSSAQKINLSSRIPASIAKPFLKWAGGKSQLLSTFELYFPESLKQGTLTAYLEPFLGSGALFFHIAQKYPLKKYTLCDINADLILAYQCVRDHLQPLITALETLQSQYWNCTDDTQRKNLYYTQRDLFNGELHLKKRTTSAKVTRAAQLIFLNRTCYNGLFRLNSQGKFNSPAGRYLKPRICDTANLTAVSKLLKHAVLKHMDFKKVMPQAGRDTFVYLDPPYRPLNRTSSFTAYAKSNFNDADQRDLATACRILHKNKAKMMLSNSDPKNTDPNDDFFDILYKGKPFNIHRIPAKRMINSNAKKRGAIHELLIRNYKL